MKIKFFSKAKASKAAHDKYVNTTKQSIKEYKEAIKKIKSEIKNIK